MSEPRRMMFLDDPREIEPHVFVEHDGEMPIPPDGLVIVVDAEGQNIACARPGMARWMAMILDREVLDGERMSRLSQAMDDATP